MRISLHTDYHNFLVLIFHSLIDWNVCYILILKVNHTKVHKHTHSENWKIFVGKLSVLNVMLGGFNKYTSKMFKYNLKLTQF